MGKMKVVCVKIPEEMLSQIDYLVKHYSFESRGGFIRAAIRDFIWIYTHPFPEYTICKERGNRSKVVDVE